MEKGFQIARDLQSDRLVHIKDIPEGYSHCVCPSCGDALVASNKNRSQRKKAIYFRHKGNKDCSPNTMLHSVAEDMLLEEKALAFPEFAEFITIPRTSKDRKEYSQFLRIAGGHETYKSTSQETRYPNSDRIADVVGTGPSGTTYIEIRVHHEVDTDKQNELRELGVDCIEIDLRELLSVEDLTIEQIKEHVIEKAPRHWISTVRYKIQIQSVIQQLKRMRAQDRSAAAAQAHDRKSFKDSMREYNADALELLKRYMIPENRKRALNTFTNRLLRDNTFENDALLQIMETFNGGVPAFLDTQVKGELAFKCHRTYWQYQIYLYLLQHIKDYVEWVTFTPQTLYEEIKGKELLTDLAKTFEESHGPIISERKVDCLKYLTGAEFEALPKPIPAIRQYCNALADIGFLEKRSGDHYRPVKEALCAFSS